MLQNVREVLAVQGNVGLCNGEVSHKPAGLGRTEEEKVVEDLKSVLILFCSSQQYV